MRLGYVERVGTGEEVATGLLSFRVGPDGQRLPATSSFYALTPSGLRAQEEWDHLGRALASSPREEPMAPPLPPTVPTITLPERFSVSTIPRLTRHLEQLEVLEESAALEEELDRLATVVEGWNQAAQDALDTESEKDSPREDRIDALEDRVEHLANLLDALEGHDVEEAVNALSGFS